jgi:8-oxo-dGTP diphosphatase
MTGREIYYVACRPIDSKAFVASVEELAELAWIAHGEIPEYVPYGLFEPVQDYLDAALFS